MKIDADFVLERRKANFWSQEELAISAGLNLRTIQRIENEGTASLQSKKALASAFDLEVSDLDYKEKTKIMRYEYKIKKYDAKGMIVGGKVELDTIEKEFNEMGAEGWELATMHDTQVSGGGTKWVVATFKRPKD